MIRIAVDAMGGDNAPVEIVKGAAKAASANANVRILLCGDESRINEILAGESYPKDGIEVIGTTQVVEMTETEELLRKRDSSMYVAMRKVHDGEADAFVSCGSTGAVLFGGQLVVGKVKGVKRPALAPLIPTAKGFSLLIDCGASMDAKPQWLNQFAVMGSAYMEHYMGVKNPRVAILNVGAEEHKGNNLVKETFPLLKENSGINFIGSIEARDIPAGYADVIVTDAFAGNVVLKMYEGVGNVLVKEIKGAMMSSLKTKIGALLIKDSLKKTLKKFDSSSYGGAPLLGCRGLVVKAHGSAMADQVATAIGQCVGFVENGVNEVLEKKLAGE